MGGGETTREHRKVEAGWGGCGLGVIARPLPESPRPGAWRGGAAGGVISVVEPLPGTGNPGGGGLRV